MKAVRRKIARPTIDSKGRGLNGQYTPRQRAEMEGQVIADSYTDRRSYADPDSLLSVQEAADFLGMSPAWLYSSDVPFVRIGRRRLYRRADLVRYAEQRLCPMLGGKRV